MVYANAHRKALAVQMAYTHDGSSLIPHFHFEGAPASARNSVRFSHHSVILTGPIFVQDPASAAHESVTRSDAASAALVTEMPHPEFTP
jgi:hypothetical protein